MSTIHATCVSLGEVAVLLRGPSGSGKSDLALRLIDRGARLVADDWVALTLENGRVVARSPAALAGLIEVRGLGPMPVPSVPAAVVGLVVDLVPEAAVERLPEPCFCAYCSVQLPLLRLNPFQASAPAKLRLAAAAAAAAAGGWPVAFTR